MTRDELKKEMEAIGIPTDNMEAAVCLANMIFSKAIDVADNCSMGCTSDNDGRCASDWIYSDRIQSRLEELMVES